ncbi:hypothetical protein Tco_0015261 [Tanacetum coccineum]
MKPPLPPPSQGTYLPEVRTELKVCETNTANSSVDEPTEVELKELPPHLEYAFLCDGRQHVLPSLLRKSWIVEEKSVSYKVIKSTSELSLGNFLTFRVSTRNLYPQDSYGRRICTSVAGHHQRRVIQIIHVVIKMEVEKLLEAGLIYTYSDSPWVSPDNCVPKKGGMNCGIVNVENE